MVQFERKIKYEVLKWDDIEKLPEPYRGQLDDVTRKIHYIRLIEGKKANSYVVVNEDEPYAETVWKLIELGETNPTALQMLMQSLDTAVQMLTKLKEV